MQLPPPGQIAKLLGAVVLGGVIVFTPSSIGLSTIAPLARTTAAPKSAVTQTATASTARSEFEKEQAMSPAQLVARWSPLIKEASRRFGVSEAWIRAVIKTETGGRTYLDDKRPITSDAGAMGIMQLMPETYEEMREQHGLGADPYDPRDNVLAGTAYLRWLYGKYGYPKLFAAYNAGPETVDAQVSGERKLPGETRAYVKRIANILGVKAAEVQPESTPPAKLIATLMRPDGSPITIDASTVDKLRASFANEYAPGVRTVVIMGEKHQGVTEDLATVASLLGHAVSKL